MAMVPPTLPPNPGQPDANTANTATAATATTAGRRDGEYRRSRTSASQAAPNRPDRPYGVSSCSPDPVITSTPSTATVNKQITPNGASGPRLRQPSSAAPAITRASATETPYSQAAGCAVVDQGAR